jgi:hypothetical protein
VEGTEGDGKILVIASQTAEAPPGQNFSPPPIGVLHMRYPWKQKAQSESMPDGESYS